jgi:agmatinase
VTIRIHDDPGAFGGLPDHCDLADSRFAVLPIAYDGTSTWLKGADKGPEAMLEASANMELYDIETDSEPWLSGIVTVASLAGYATPEDMVAAVKGTALELIEAGKTVVGLGGEHSVSIGLIQAHAARYPGLNVLQFDAHSDTRDQYEGSANNHACVMARAAEICPYVQVGIRSMDAAEKKLLDPARTFFGHTFTAGDEEIAAVIEKLDGPVYVTIDLDVLDPAEMPSTGTPEPGGMSYLDLVKVLRAVCAARSVVGFDVVELLPNPGNKAPDFLAARLVYQLMAYLNRH